MNKADWTIILCLMALTIYILYLFYVSFTEVERCKEFGELVEWHDGLCYLYNETTGEVYKIINI